MKAICAGTYDPITRGHVDVIQRASTMYETVYVAVVADPNHKKTLFSLDQRIAFIKEAVKDLSNVEVVPFEGLLAHKAQELDARAIVRGLRAVSDFEYELQIANLNRNLAPDVETVFLMARPEYSFISSSGVREIARFGGDVSIYVNPVVQEALAQHFS